MGGQDWVEQLVRTGIVGRSGLGIEGEAHESSLDDLDLRCLSVHIKRDDPGWVPGPSAVWSVVDACRACQRGLRDRAVPGGPV